MRRAVINIRGGFMRQTTFAIGLVSLALTVSASVLAQTSTDTTGKNTPAVQTAESQAGGSKLVIVLVHTSCGAVKGSIEDAKLGNLTELLAKIRPAVSASGPGSSKDDAYVTKVAQANVSQAMKEIREKSPTIKAQLDAGTVGLVGAIYDVSTGKVTFLPEWGESLSPPFGTAVLALAFPVGSRRFGAVTRILTALAQIVASHLSASHAR